MAEKIVSPGVFTKEIDQTFLPAAVAEIGGAVVGPTVKGPVLTPTIVTSYSEYQAMFGDSFKSGSNYYSYMTSIAAKNYLKNANKLTVVRILAGSYTHASAAISSSTDPSIFGSGSIQATGSFHFDAAGTASLGGNGDYNLITSFSIGSVNFHFTSGSTVSTGHYADSSTNIYITTMSRAHASDNPNTIAADIRDVINMSQSVHGLAITASATSSFHSATVSHHMVGITASIAGAFDVNYGIGTQQLSASMLFTTGSTHTGTKRFQMSGSGNQLGTNPDDAHATLNTRGLALTGGTPAGGSDTTSSIHGLREVFKLHTLASGEIINSVGPIGSNNALASGSKDNLRYDISSVNFKRGLFTLLIRKGDDTHTNKKVLETWDNVSLDPNDNSYIAKVIGDQVLTLRGSGTSEPYLQLSGSYPNKSKYVRVEVLQETSDYLDVNGDIRVNAASASLPAFHSGSNSGSFGGSFSGGSDGNVINPKLMYENIAEDSVQGLDPSSDGSSNGYDSYIDALNLLSNADEYDLNLIMLPGIIDSVHSSVITKAINVCEDRGDCFVLADPVEHNKTIGAVTDRSAARNSNYAAMYWPWVQIAENQLGRPVWVPPSVAVAGVYSFNDKVSQPWFAPAGLDRGKIDSVVTAERKLTESNRDTLYQSNINPIATFPKDGVVVWGQKTLQKRSTALDRVNVRRLMIKLKKFIASSSRYLVFEQNTSATRRRFLNIVNPFMEQVQANSGLTAFRVVMDESNNTPDVIDRNILYGQIFVQPARTAEFIVLDFTVQPTGATFPEL